MSVRVWTEWTENVFNTELFDVLFILEFFFCLHHKSLAVVSF